MRGRPHVIALAAALCAGLAGCGPGDDPSLREQYGGHGGSPTVHTGAAGRLALDGRWRVALDRSDEGRDRGWQRGGFAGEAVTLPYVPNAREITGAAGERSHEGSIAWYRTVVRVPRTAT